MSDTQAQAGEPGEAGKPGKDGGGAGGKGGRGGKGGGTRKLSATRRRFTVVGYLFLSMGVAGAFWFSNKADEKVSEQALLNCHEIENVKKAGRASAWRDFNNLDNSLVVLKIEKTPEIVAIAKGSRDARLALFIAEPCPRVFP